MKDDNTEHDILLDLLFRSLDGKLEEADAAKLNGALQQESWLKDELELMNHIRYSLASMPVLEDKGFVDSVMNHTIHKKGNKVSGFQIFHALWPLSAAAAIIVFVIATSVIYFTSETFNTDAILGVEEMAIESIYVLND